MCADIIVSSERKAPAESSHQLYLKLTNSIPLSVQVPWPFLVEDVKPTLRYQKTKENCPAKLILKKSLNDAWPCEFKNGSRWNIDCMIPWQQCQELTEDDIDIHMNTQFPEQELHSIFRDHNPPSTPLNEVRMMMRLINYSLNTKFRFHNYLNFNQ